MDRPVKKSRFNTRTLAAVGGGIAILLLIVAAFYSTSGGARLNVESERITVSDVRRGPFREFITINGVVLPVTTIYLDAVEGGRVEEIFVEDGAMLQKDQAILKLSNTDLELDLANRETAVFDLITNMQNTRNLSEQNSISQQYQLADVDNALTEAERVYLMNKELYDQKVVAEQPFRSSENLYKYQKRRKELAERTRIQDSISMNTQLKQMQQSLDRMQSALQLMRKKAGDLTVRAPVAGQLTSLDAEIGESKTRGERLGQLDVMSGFKVRADIDEHYIARIFVGLPGEFTFDGKSYALRVSKIYSQVNNGRFQVDLEFVSDVPQGIRRGQTLQVRLALSDETEAVLLPRGAFYQQTGGNWIFKVDASGNKAYRSEIQLGRQSPDFYEVLSGVEPGDRVVTSSYAGYEDKQELIIKGE
ncbi:MAG: HlyD family efflux transporter periplasmic adaptor subunit [Bacteroidetes bacterium]|nr:MAG: HlyD family efflux transporter periplasmic adaptor subunit [Bacteroidota bacterium]